MLGHTCSCRLKPPSMFPPVLEELLRVGMVLHLDPRVASAVHIEEEEEEEEEDDLVRAHVPHAASSQPVNPAEPSRPLRDLRPMLVNDLQLGWRHKGRVLYGELSAEPFKMVAVHTMVADETGQAVKLCVYNATRHKRNPQEFWTLFCKGLKVAIKEPYFKVAMDGSHIIRVDDPADFVRSPKIRKGSGSRNNSQSPSPSSSPSLLSSPSWCKALVRAVDLRGQGNQAFAGQDWKKAIQLYTEAVQLLLQSRGTSSSTIVPEVSKELALAFSNRAEARLRLKHFEAANVDAGKALKRQPCNVKSLFRRGRALHGLHQYMEAVLCFKEALNVRDGDAVGMKDMTEALKASEVCDKQARTGEYNLVGLWKEVEGGKEPVCGEFIGPVEIGPARERALGRGLLVTRDVEPGDLLLVSKAVAHAKADPFSSVRLRQEGNGSEDTAFMNSVYHEELTQQVLSRAMSSTRFRDQVYCLAANSATGMGGIEGNIPTVDMFSASNKSTTRCDDVIDDVSLSLENIDVGKICGVIKANVFEFEHKSHAALWLLPSFINHSCTPNSCWMTFGKEALFVRAAHHLTKGQEVTISYLDAAAVPYSWRALSYQCDRCFDCRCERCSFERSLQPFTKPLEAKLAMPLDVTGAAEVVASLEWAFQNVKAFENEKQKQWLRTSYALSFAVALRDPSLQQRTRKLFLLETVLRAVQETLGGSESFLSLVKDMVHDSECSPHVNEILANMYVCLYGKQPPATLRVLLALRDSMMQKSGTDVWFSFDSNRL